jgi:5-methylcytosine-specific restriction enzyme A
MINLHALRPITKQTVKEITQQLGITMTSQYDWCFSNSIEGPHLLNIWHEDMIEENGEIYFIDDSAEWSDKNRKTAVQVQLNRASAMTSLILTAYHLKNPVGVAILAGLLNKINARETSEAHKRELDSVEWYPHHRGNDGRIRVIRGKPQPADFDPSEELGYGKPLTIPTSPQKIDRKGTETFERDSEVVKLAKSRASDGRCELCGKEGFKTANGNFYLEGHHVIPLNCGGPDDVRNVVAICADDHRRAHYGE